MARKLRPEIKGIIQHDNQLAADFATALGVSFISLPQMLYRNTGKLAHHDSVSFLCERLQKAPDQILTDDDANVEPEYDTEISHEKALP